MDLKELKALLRLMEGNDVEELEVEEGGRRVRIRRRGAPPATMPTTPLAAAAPRPAPAATLVAGPAPDSAGLVPVESPMVGTFYRAPAPGAEAYVKEGDTVEKGAVLCIIEAMKLMNEIEAEVRGRIAKILVENGQPVEFGQTLFLLEPA
jgi:acetyl-CoA carboxylase biotin carboxyl carrier protein